MEQGTLRDIRSVCMWAERTKGKGNRERITEAWLHGVAEAYKRKLTTLNLDRAASLLQREADQRQRCSKQSIKVDNRDKIGQVVRPGCRSQGWPVPRSLFRDETFGSIYTVTANIPGHPLFSWCPTVIGICLCGGPSMRRHNGSPPSSHIATQPSHLFPYDLISGRSPHKLAPRSHARSPCAKTLEEKRKKKPSPLTTIKCPFSLFKIQTWKKTGKNAKKVDICPSLDTTQGNCQNRMMQPLPTFVRFPSTEPAPWFFPLTPNMFLIYSCFVFSGPMMQLFS